MSNLMLDVDQAGELKAAFRRGDWTNQQIKQLCEGDMLAQFRQVLLGHASIMPIERAEPIPSAPLDTVIRVDRAVRPVYPDWMKKVMHPGLEATGPAEYDLAALQLWLHEQQKQGVMRGHALHDHLTSNNMLESCVGLSDLLEIQKKGIAVYRKFFAGKVLFGWKSVVQPPLGDLIVPYLIEYGGAVALNWHWLDRDWYGGYPAARFAS